MYHTRVFGLFTMLKVNNRSGSGLVFGGKISLNHTMLIKIKGSMQRYLLAGQSWENVFFKILAVDNHHIQLACDKVVRVEFVGSVFDQYTPVIL